MNKKIYSELKNDTWTIMSDQKRMDLLNRIEAAIAKKYKRKPCGINLIDDAGLLGYYSPSNEKIMLCKSIIGNAGKAIAAVIHEGRHAYQHEQTKKTSNDAKITQ